MRFFSFTKADRILKRPEFIYMPRFGKKLQDRHFIVVFCRRLIRKTRLGVTVTRKVGDAATRNRIKRLAREYFRLNKHKITGKWDINIIPKKTAADITSDQAFLSLQSIFNRIGED